MGKVKDPKKITVYGAGSFGTAMAHLLKNQGHDVLIWSRDQLIADEINAQHTNSTYFSNRALAPFSATTILEKATNHGEILLFAIPCQFLASFIKNIQHSNLNHKALVNLAKGIEVDTCKTPHQIFTDRFGQEILKQYVMLSGPTFARELINEFPAAAVLAGFNEDLVKNIQTHLSTTFFRLYRSDDVIGVELGGALKNIMAIASGIVDGLGFGMSARASNMTRCLSEMIQIGLALGAKEKTFSGLSGIGDLILTCTGDLSRNRQVGLKLGEGQSIDKIKASSRQVAEGVTTAKSVYSLIQEKGLDLPNCETVYKILYENLPVKEAVLQILSRTLRPE